MPIVPALGLRAESFGEELPEWAMRLFEQLNAHSTQVAAAISEIAESAQALNKTFTSDGSGLAYVDLKNPFDRKPEGVVVIKINPADGSAMASVYSATWAVASDRIRVLFAGLSASTKYRFSAEIT